MRNFLILILLPLSLTLSAQEAESRSAGRIRLITADMPGVVIQDTAVYNMLDRRVNGSSEHVLTIDGYRVQVFSSNQQQEAKQQALMLEQQLLEKISEPVYVQYATPFWKVRVGNFRTLQEASSYQQELGQLMPEIQASSYVVRDKIEILL